MSDEPFVSSRPLWRRVFGSTAFGLVLVWPWLLTVSIAELHEGFSIWKLYLVVIVSSAYAMTFASWMKESR